MTIRANADIRRRQSCQRFGRTFEPSPPRRACCRSGGLAPPTVDCPWRCRAFECSRSCGQFTKRARLVFDTLAVAATGKVSVLKSKTGKSGNDGIENRPRRKQNRPLENQSPVSGVGKGCQVALTVFPFGLFGRPPFLPALLRLAFSCCSHHGANTELIRPAWPAA